MWSTDGRCGVMVTRAGRREKPAAHETQRTRGAHHKHVAHVCDAGRVEAQRLVERGSLSNRSIVASVGARCGPGGGRRGAKAVNGVCREECAGWGHGMRGAHHAQHAAHGYDAGRVEIQRLVKRRRVLPSREKGIKYKESKAKGRGIKAAARKLLLEIGVYARAERT